nr:MAG TPA: hypothetical protein [Caudoviricetes sp.]
MGGKNRLLFLFRARFPISRQIVTETFCVFRQTQWQISLSRLSMHENCSLIERF